MELLQEWDYKQITGVLENKIPQEKIRKILMEIKKASDLQDHGDSPYTRPTFSKLLLLFILIITVVIWLIIPVYNLIFSSTWTSTATAKIIEERKQPLNTSFSFTAVVEKTLDDKDVISLYDKNWLELLAKADLENNKALLLSSKIDGSTIKTSELQMLKSTNADLSEDIKEDVLDMINKNIRVNDSYLDFKNIDFWVDQIINIQ